MDDPEASQDDPLRPQRPSPLPPPDGSIGGSGAFLGPTAEHAAYGYGATLPPATQPPPPPRKPRRRWPWVLAVLVLLAGATVATLVALDQRDAATLWRDRALAVEAQRDQAVDRGDELAGQLDELSSLLTASEGDVVMLEERIRELADEKAQAEDAATTTQVERDVVVQVTSEIAAATDALDACVDRLFELQAASVEAFNLAAAGEPVDVEPLNARARETTSFCNDARGAAARASAAAQQLTTP